MFAATDFNADFYIVAATVIPVLFLALTLQSEFINETALKMRQWHRERTRQMLRAGMRETGWKPALKRIASGAVMDGVAKLIYQAAIALPVVLGTFGELCAVAALASHHATSREAAWSKSALYVLSVLVGGWAFARFEVSAFRQFMEQIEEWREADRSPGRRADTEVIETTPSSEPSG